MGISQLATTATFRALPLLNRFPLKKEKFTNMHVQFINILTYITNIYKAFIIANYSSKL